MDCTTLLLALAEAKASLSYSVKDDCPIIHVYVATSQWLDTFRTELGMHKPWLLQLLMLTIVHRASAETLLGWHDWYEERAGILQYMAGLSRHEAEQQAFELLRQREQQKTS